MSINVEVNKVESKKLENQGSVQTNQKIIS